MQTGESSGKDRKESRDQETSGEVRYSRQVQAAPRRNDGREVSGQVRGGERLRYQGIPLLQVSAGSTSARFDRPVVTLPGPHEHPVDHPLHPNPGTHTVGTHRPDSLAGAP